MKFPQIALGSTTIKTKLVAIALFVTIALGILYVNSLIAIKSHEKLSKIAIGTMQIEKDMLTLRRNEKDFLARNDLKYVDNFNKNLTALLEHTNTLQQEFIEQDLVIGEMPRLKEVLADYGQKFNALAQLQQTIGLDTNSGLYGTLRDAVHAVEERLKAENNKVLLADMLMLRRNEKDFMLRLDMKYSDRLDKNIALMQTNVKNSELADNTKQQVNQLINTYHSAFNGLVKATVDKGLTAKDGLLGEMRTTIHQSEESLDILSKHISQEIAEHAKVKDILTLTMTIIFSTLIVTSLIYLCIIILRPIKKLTSTMHEVRHSKDLSLRCNVSSNDEFGQLASDFNSMLDDFHQTLEKIHHACAQLDCSSETLASIAGTAKNNMDTQASQTEQAATAMNQMSATVHEVSSNILSTAQASDEANNETIQGKAVVDNTVTEINQLAESIKGSVVAIQRVEQDSDNISTVLDVIKGIAEQTNLLALNAAIEAARAGEQGRGFAVVADEVRTLAGRTQESTEEINQVIEKLQQGARQAVESMHKSQSSAESVVERAEQAGISLNTIAETVNRINDMSSQIATAAEEQNATAEDISRNITQINEMMLDSKEWVDKTTSSSQSLSTLASEMKSLVNEFKL